MKRLMLKTGSSDYLKIHSHTFRHFYAADLYAKTKDLVLVKERLGYSDLKPTLVYVHLIQTGKTKYKVRKVDIETIQQ